MRRNNVFDIPERNLLLTLPGPEARDLDANNVNVTMPAFPAGFTGATAIICNRFARRAMMYYAGDTYFFWLDINNWVIALSSIAIPSGFVGFKYSCRGNVIAVLSTSQGIQIYDAITFDLKATISLGGASVTSCAWNKSDTQLAITQISSPYIKVYDFASGAFLSNPATLPTGSANYCDFSISGLLAVAHDNTPYITVYQMSGFVKLNNPTAPLPAENGVFVKFDHRGQNVFIKSYALGNITWTGYEMPGMSLAIGLPWPFYDPVLCMAIADNGRLAYWESNGVVKMSLPEWAEYQQYWTGAVFTRHSFI